MHEFIYFEINQLILSCYIGDNLVHFSQIFSVSRV
jgi:hypothetical protein